MTQDTLDLINIMAGSDFDNFGYTKYNTVSEINEDT